VPKTSSSESHSCSGEGGSSITSGMLQSYPSGGR
jgi:hypothetical protein